MNESLEEKESWDPRKIAVLIILVAALAFGLKNFVLDKRFNSQGNSFKENPSAVAGVSTQNNLDTTPVPTISVQKNLENGLNDIKREVNNINVVEIATSTPAVQKIINDFKSLQNLPQSQAKDACLKICSGL